MTRLSSCVRFTCTDISILSAHDYCTAAAENKSYKGIKTCKVYYRRTKKNKRHRRTKYLG